MKHPWPLVLLLATCLQASAQDVYQVLRASGDGFAEVTPGHALSFPADHLPHPDFRIEWWYLTANLEDAQGRDYGLHWTLFRQSLRPSGPTEGWLSNQVWMAHASLTTPTGHRFEERFARGGTGQADVALVDGRFTAWLDDWHWQGRSNEPIPGRLTFALGESQISLRLDATTPWVLQGDAGYSQKSGSGQASYYYSQPHIRVEATWLRPSGERIALEGTGWMDREWSSQPLAPDQQGWDWFSLHLDDGHALMVYRLRHDSGAHNLSGTWIRPDGHSTYLSQAQIQLTAGPETTLTLSDGSAVSLPVNWQLALPEKGLSWQIDALYPNQWLETQFPYWEGPVRVSGSSTGIGYMELTGY
ncbi:MAG: lipocalin-like domain-containing protein [Saccharospirillum sp.]